MTESSDEQRRAAEEYLTLFGDGKTTVEDVLRTTQRPMLNRRIARKLMIAPVMRSVYRPANRTRRHR